MPSTRCLSEDTIAQFINGQLGSEERDRVDDHIGKCSECRSLVADSARSLHDDAANTHDATFVTEPPERPRRASLRPGDTVGRYIVGELIGVGGMGVIYLAQDPQLSRTIILKLLRDDRRTGRLAQAHLLREAQAMAQLSHPNVVAVYDVGTYGAQVFVAMEYVDGETLTQWLGREGHRRRWQEICAVFLDAGRALAAAHAVRIVHRDFKPSNVLLGADGRVRVTDFGLARPVDAETSSVHTPTDPMLLSSSDFADWDLAMTLTETGAVKGTPAYMAPEQYTSGPVDERTDQYSFCVALYEALYGQRPFLSTSVAGLARQVAGGQVSIPASDRDVPPLINEALLRGLSSRPADRHPSMQDLLALLTTAVHGSSAGRQRRWRNRAVAVGVGIALVGGGGLALLVATGVLGRRAPAPAGPAAPVKAGRAAAATAGPAAPADRVRPAIRAPRTDATSAAAKAAVVRAPRKKPRKRARSSPRARSSRRRDARLRRPDAPSRASPAPSPRRPYDDEPLVPSFARER